MNDKNHNIPYQTYIDRGYFNVVEKQRMTPYGPEIYTQTLVTGKGQIYIVEKLRDEFIKDNNKSHYVYFLKDEQNNVKIGITSNLKNRIGSIQTGNSQEVNLLHYIGPYTQKQATDLEKELHKMFSEYHLRGEWFVGEPIIDFISGDYFTIGNVEYEGMDI